MAETLQGELISDLFQEVDCPWISGLLGGFQPVVVVETSRIQFTSCSSNARARRRVGVFIAQNLVFARLSGRARSGAAPDWWSNSVLKLQTGRPPVVRLARPPECNSA